MDVEQENNRIDQMIVAGLDKFDADDYEGAFRDFDAVLLLDKDNTLANIFAGGCLIRLGRFDAAEPLVRKGVALAPQAIQAHIFLAEALWATERYDEAESELREALALEPRNPEAHFQLGRFYLRSDSQKARAQFERAIELKPDHAEAHFQLGVCLHQANELDQAISKVARAFKLQPRFETAYLYYARLCLERSQRYDHHSSHFKLVELARAQAALRSAVGLNPNNQEAKELMALVNEGIREFDSLVNEDIREFDALDTQKQKVSKDTFSPWMLVPVLILLGRALREGVDIGYLIGAVFVLGIVIALLWGERKKMSLDGRDVADDGWQGPRLPDPYAKSERHKSPGRAE